MNWIIVISLIVFFVVCAEVYSMRKMVENLIDEIHKLRKSIREDVKNRDYLIEELHEKEEECVRLSDRIEELENIINPPKKRKSKLFDGHPDVYKNGMELNIDDNGVDEIAVVVTCGRYDNEQYVVDDNGDVVELFLPHSDIELLYKTISELNKIVKNYIVYEIVDDKE